MFKKIIKYFLNAVLGEYFVFCRSRKSKGVALTFDDGPHPENTPLILKILKDRNIKATFFVLGSQIESCPELTRQVLEDGHEFGNHSYDHINIKRASWNEIYDSMSRTQKLIKHIGCTSPLKLFRVPYGLFNIKIFLFILRYGYILIHWTIDSRDSFNISESDLCTYFDRHLFAHIQTGDIVLFHEDYLHTVQALPYILDQLIKKGFHFMTVGKMLQERYCKTCK